MIRVSVTSLDKYAAYLNEEDYPLDVLLRDLRGQTPRTPAMDRGRAFAKAMEKVSTSDSSMLVAEGHAFAFTCDAEIEAWPRRELKAEKDYGGIIVSARCDRLHGKVIADDKSTSHFSGDAGVEKYIDKWQPRFYMDIFGATSFIWHIWECREIDIKEPRDYPGVRIAWEVFNHHVFTLPRYPAMEDDCRNFALEYKTFAEAMGL
jgi:hypothetical protein